MDILYFSFIDDDKSGVVELKWTMGTGLVVQNNAPLTSSSELIAYRFFDEVESNKIG